MSQAASYATPTPADASVNWTSWLRKLGAMAGLIAVFVLFTALRPRTFPAVNNLQVMALQTAVVGIAALGMTFIIISGGIDLSVGAQIALVTMVIAWLLKNTGTPPLAAAVLGALAASACGALIGLLVAKLRLIPFVVTLGFWGAYRGLAKGIGNEQPINPRPTWLNDLLTTPTGSQSWMLVAPGVWVMIALALLAGGVLRYTRFGRHVFAVGSNEQTARLCGVPVDRAKLLIYTLGATFAGIAGVLQYAYLNQGDPTTANGMELNVIAAVVIGGTSLTGGQGTILGTLVGALFMTVIGNGCTKLGIPNWLQDIITGVIIILAHWIDRVQRGRGE